jgi:hypothetical protein
LASSFVGPQKSYELKDILEVIHQSLAIFFMCMVYLFVDPDEFNSQRAEEISVRQSRNDWDWLKHVTFAVYLLPFFSFAI